MFNLFQKNARQVEKENLVNAMLVRFHGNPDFRPHRPDAPVYEVMIRNNGQISTLTIRIPEKFPDLPPDIIVSAGPLKTSGHSWIGSYGTIKGSQKLREWNKATSSLADIVVEIVGALQAGMIPPAPMQQQQQQGGSMNMSAYPLAPGGVGPGFVAVGGRSSLMPPTVQQIQQQHFQPPAVPVPVALPFLPQPASLAPTQGAGPGAGPHSSSGASISSRNNSHDNLTVGVSTSSSTSMTTSHSNPILSSTAASAQPQAQAQAQAQAQPRTPKPPIPAAFPQLQSLSETQLERVLSDPVALAATLSNFVEVDSLREYRDLERRKCIQLAEDTLRREPELERLGKELKAAQDQLRHLATAYSTALDGKRKLFMTESEVRAAAERQVKVLEANSAKCRERLMVGARAGEGVQELIKVS